MNTSECKCLSDEELMKKLPSHLKLSDEKLDSLMWYVRRSGCLVHRYIMALPQQEKGSGI